MIEPSARVGYLLCRAGIRAQSATSIRGRSAIRAPAGSIWASSRKRTPLHHETVDVTSAIHLSAMSDPEHEDYQLVILDVVYDTVVTDADAELSPTSLELNAARRTRVNGEAIDGLK